ncbi:NUDIX hydrolase [Catenulispora sp. GP43]|uniref:NUDIX hydrolase n=1 Tax=Catenulispora sp. GP43 TaxID=3156263 RepID=UPI003515C0FB
MYPAARPSRVTDTAIRDLLASYLTRHPDQAERLRPFTAALADPEHVTGLTDRGTRPGHVTTGAFVVAADGRLLQIAHKSLHRWLNPGGHTEPEDASLADAARRELREETGLGEEHVTLIGDPVLPLAIDAHRIPANPAKGEPEHWHFDFRYAFLLNGTPDATDVELQLEEVDDYRWIPLEQADLGQDAARLAAVLAGAVTNRAAEGS